MPAVTFTPADLVNFRDVPEAQARDMIDDAMALAARIAPCILDDDFEHAAAAKAIIRGAILRWIDAGSGVVSQRQAGPFGEMIDTRQPRRSMFWPTEISDLQELCTDDDAEDGAFSVDTVPTDQPTHAETCSLRFGAAHCSCGAYLTGLYALYGT